MSHSGYCQNIKFCWIVDDARRCHWPSLFLLETCNQNQTSCDFCRGSSQPPINSEPGLQHCNIIHCVLFLYQWIPRCPCTIRGPFVFELGTELISSGPAATKTWLDGQDSLHLEYIGMPASYCLAFTCVAHWFFCDWFRLTKAKIDQHAELSIFCSGVSDLVFLHATPPSHLGPWQLWKILCRRFRTWSNDSKIECSFGSAAEWWVRLQSEALCIFFRFCFPWRNLLWVRMFLTSKVRFLRLVSRGSFLCSSTLPQAPANWVSRLAWIFGLLRARLSQQRGHLSHPLQKKRWLTGCWQSCLLYDYNSRWSMKYDERGIFDSQGASSNIEKGAPLTNITNCAPYDCCLWKAPQRRSWVLGIISIGTYFVEVKSRRSCCTIPILLDGWKSVQYKRRSSER